MEMTLYRIQKAKHWNGKPEPGFSCVGRWHSGGRPILYLAESPALAVLEWIKSKMSQGLIEMEISRAKLQLASITLELDSAVVPTVAPTDLPCGWEKIPNINSESTQKLGNAWLASRQTPALRVPSATLPLGMGWNILLNPGHLDYPTPFPSSSFTATSFSLDYYLAVPPV